MPISPDCVYIAVFSTTDYRVANVHGNVIFTNIRNNSTSLSATDSLRSVLLLLRNSRTDFTIVDSAPALTCTL